MFDWLRLVTRQERKTPLANTRTFTFSLSYNVVCLSTMLRMATVMFVHEQE